MTVRRPNFQRRRNPRPGRFNGRRSSADTLGLSLVAIAALTFLGALFADGGPLGGLGLYPHVLDGQPWKALNYYPRCADAEAAGVAPIHRGEPGYRPKLDADDDGVACEPYRGM
jgi:hypothetical protein